MRAMVTGASHGGIGGEICRKLARDAAIRGGGAKIAACVTGTRPEIRDLIAELRGLGADAVALTGDLADPAVPARLVAEAVQFCGGLDALVANAALRRQASLLDLDIQAWDDVFAVNVRATWLLAKAAHPALKESAGSIVAITSIAGIHPHLHGGPYTPSKAAEISLCELLAQEWARDGIRVNSIAPGIIRTRHAAAVYADEKLAAARDDVVPMGRVGRPEDIAGAVAMLIGPDAAYVTGQSLVVDGGFAASVMARVPGRPPPAKS
jgi:glucose 1-dehydrogenase